MDSKFHKKIRRVVTGAQLTPELSRELSLELESYFYEKERDLQFKGVKPTAIEQQMEAEFGEEESIAKNFQRVHSHPFYSFIQSFMKDDTRPYLFENIFVFLLLLLVFHNFLWDMNLRLETNVWDDPLLISLVMLMVLLGLGFLLAARMFLGKTQAQKTVGILLALITLGHGVFAFSLLDGTILPQNPFTTITDQDLIDDPEDYDEWDEAPWISYENETEGYTISLPMSYMAFYENGSDLAKNLTGLEEEISSFGPAWASNASHIGIEVFDAYNATDKSQEETWSDYYIRTRLSDKAMTAEKDIEDNETFHAILSKITLKEELYMGDLRKDLLLVEKNNRLYSFLYTADDAIHQSILFGGGLGFFVPEDRIVWTRYANPACPYSLELPDYWGGFFGMGRFEELATIEDEDCWLEGFRAPDGEDQTVGVEWMKTTSIDDYIDFRFADREDTSILGQEDLTWQYLPARKVAIERLNDLGEIEGRETVLLIQVQGNVLAFTYHAGFPIEDHIIESIIVNK